MPFTRKENIDYFNTTYKNQVIGNKRQLHWIERRHVHIGPRLVGTVLDLGCGLGMLADRTTEKYLGVDYSEVAIEYAKANTKNQKAEFILGGLFKFLTGVDDDSWDTVVLGEVLEHFKPDPRGALLAEAKRIAAKRVVISVPENSPNPSHIQHRWTFDQVEALIGIAEIVRTRGHYYAVWEKNGRATSMRSIVEVAKANCKKCGKKN